MLELWHLSGGYRGEDKVKEISARFREGEVTAVVGPNGCGKSTLLKLIVRLLKPTSGKILLEGVDAASLTRREFARKVSFLPQARAVPHMSAGALVLHGRYPYLSYSRRYSKKDFEAVEDALAATGTEKFRDIPLESLSGGERQKVYLAMLIAQDTDVVLLDEPTTYLDISRQFELMSLIGTLRQRGKTVVAVLHDLGLALRYADRILVLEHGKLRACGSPDDIYHSGTIDCVFQIHTRRISSPAGVEYVFSPERSS